MAQHSVRWSAGALPAQPPVASPADPSRAKQTTQEWRDHADRIDIEDPTLHSADGEYRYIEIDNSRQTVAQTVASIKAAIPEIYR